MLLTEVISPRLSQIYVVAAYIKVLSLVRKMGQSNGSNILQFARYFLYEALKIKNKKSPATRREPKAKAKSAGGQYNTALSLTNYSYNCQVGRKHTNGRERWTATAQADGGVTQRNGRGGQTGKSFTSVAK